VVLPDLQALDVHQFLDFPEVLVDRFFLSFQEFLAVQVVLHYHVYL
jgi:hypothetical protein